MKGTLYIKRARGREIREPRGIEGELDLDTTGTACFIVLEEGIVIKLLRARVEFIAADGLLISGVKEITPGILHYREWWFVAEVRE